MNKEELTAAFLKEAGIDSVDVKKWMWKLWRNPFSKTSLRLTDEGFVFLNETLGLENYTYKLPKGQYDSSKIYIWMDKHISTPFWLDGRTKIIFFGTRDSMMLSLYGNDLKAYLQTLQNG